jgi:UDP-N-acetylmuramoyl-tripeptide--D-alanyl-D-alanine ligase
VGRAHIGFFGSVEETAREKTDVLRFLEAGGTGVVNADDRLLAAALADIDAGLVTFGVEQESNFRAEEISQGPAGTRFTVGGREIVLPAPGLHNVYNALAAIAAASLLGVEIGDAAGALASFEPVRVAPAAASSVTILDDSYNANPDSVRAALDILSVASARRKVFILGEMLELGSESERLHREVGSMLAASGIDLLIGIGGHTRSAVEEAIASGMDSDSALFFETKSDARRYLATGILEGDAILIKGSRLAGLEEISKFIKSAVEGRI